jgi:hypothetical protein
MIPGDTALASQRGGVWQDALTASGLERGACVRSACPRPRRRGGGGCPTPRRGRYAIPGSPCGARAGAGGRSRAGRRGRPSGRPSAGGRAGRPPAPWPRGPRGSGAWRQTKDRRLGVRWARGAPCVEAFLALATLHSGIQRLERVMHSDVEIATICEHMAWMGMTSPAAVRPCGRQEVPPNGSIAISMQIARRHLTFQSA